MDVINIVKTWTVNSKMEKEEKQVLKNASLTEHFIN